MILSRVQDHGPERQYLRVTIPVCIQSKLDLSSGGLVSWDIVDSKTVILRVKD